MTDLRFVSISLALVAVAACDPGSKSVTASDTLGNSESGGGTGGDPGDTEGTGGGSGGGPGVTSTTGMPPQVEACLEEITVLAPDEVSALGFSAQPLLALQDGWSLDFHWTTDNGGIDVVPEGTTTQVDLGLTHAGGEIRFIDSEINPEYDGGGIEIDPECNDRMEIDMVISLSTIDGRFDEEFTTTCVATTADQMSWIHDVDPDGFSGTFSSAEVTFPDDNGTVDMFSLRGQFVAGADPTGGLWIEITQWLPGGDPEDAFVGFGIIAGWPNFGE